MGLEEARVNRWDDGEEGDGLSCWRGEEGGCETFPDVVGVEGVHELDCAAR